MLEKLTCELVNRQPTCILMIQLVQQHINLLLQLFQHITIVFQNSIFLVEQQTLVRKFIEPTSTVSSAKLKRFCTTDVSSRIRRPFSPKTCCVRVASIIISVRVGVTLTSTPL